MIALLIGLNGACSHGGRRVFAFPRENIESPGDMALLCIGKGQIDFGGDLVFVSAAEIQLKDIIAAERLGPGIL